MMDHESVQAHLNEFVDSDIIKFSATYPTLLSATELLLKCDLDYTC